MQPLGHQMTQTQIVPEICGCVAYFSLQWHFYDVSIITVMCCLQNIIIISSDVCTTL